MVTVRLWSTRLFTLTMGQKGSLVMLDMGRETVGVLVAGRGVQVTEVWSSEMAMMPSLFLKTALPLGVVILRKWHGGVSECQDKSLLSLVELKMVRVIPPCEQVY